MQAQLNSNTATLKTDYDPENKISQILTGLNDTYTVYTGFKWI